MLSTIEFDSTGEQLATGDRGGRVVLFEREDGRPEEVRRQASGKRPLPCCVQRPEWPALALARRGWETLQR